MAEQDIADIAATADGDTSWGDDLRGAIATLKDTRHNRIVSSALDDARLTAPATHMITSGPWVSDTSGSTPALIAGLYQLGLVECRGGTPTNVEIEVVTGVASCNAYYVLYNLDANGMAGSLANSWGPFSAATSASFPELTGQTQTIVPGMYWAGLMMPAGNAGSPVFTGGRTCYQGAVRQGFEERFTLYLTSSDATPAASHTLSMRNAAGYDSQAANVAYLYGKIV